MNIYPAILTDSLAEFQTQLDSFTQLPDSVQTIHVDIIDGEFADNFTITPTDLMEIDAHNFFFDYHLMVNQPEDYLQECFDISRARAIIGQVEHLPKQQPFLEEIIQHELQPGLSLDLFTPVEAIDEESWRNLKVIQLMGIEAGFQGKEMNVKLLTEKIQEVKNKIQELELPELELMIDGGVNKHTLPLIKNTGIDSVVVGSALGKSEDMVQTFRELESIISS